MVERRVQHRVTVTDRTPGRWVATCLCGASSGPCPTQEAIGAWQERHLPREHTTPYWSGMGEGGTT